jgi:hypothetical protein
MRFTAREIPPERGALIPEGKGLRHLLFGKKPNTYRIIHAIDKGKYVVSALHIRHGAHSSWCAASWCTATGAGKNGVKSGSRPLHR